MPSCCVFVGPTDAFVYTIVQVSCVATRKERLTYCSSSNCSLELVCAQQYMSSRHAMDEQWWEIVLCMYARCGLGLIFVGFWFLKTIHVFTHKCVNWWISAPAIQHTTSQNSDVGKGQVFTHSGQRSVGNTRSTLVDLRSSRWRALITTGRDLSRVRRPFCDPEILPRTFIPCPLPSKKTFRV